MPDDDPDRLRAEAEQLRREMALLQARADALGRRALELEARAREIENAGVVVPIRKRWGGLVVVDGVASVENARRSANPDDVAREARLECVKPGAEAKKAKGEETRQRVEAAWHEGLKAGGKMQALADDIVKRLGVSETTAWKYKPES
jgi:hypothetical protein